MTEDPVKLYVVVMGILVAVLGWVANTSYEQSAAYNHAIEDAPKQAKKFRQRAARVTGLINQLNSSKLGKTDHITLVNNAARRNLGGRPSVQEERAERISARAKQLSWKVVVSKGSRAATQPVTRNQIAKFCRDVERDSQGILRVIDIQMRRDQGDASVPLGADKEIRDERYTCTIVVGMRVVGD